MNSWLYSGKHEQWFEMFCMGVNKGHKFLNPQTELYKKFNRRLDLFNALPNSKFNLIHFLMEIIFKIRIILLSII